LLYFRFGIICQQPLLITSIPNNTSSEVFIVVIAQILKGSCTEVLSLDIPKESVLFSLW
jgi:hypothetical protein